MPQAARNLRGGGAGREGDRLSIRDHGGGGQGNAPFLIGEPLLAQREGGVEAKGLVAELAGDLGAAVGSIDKATLFELDQVATNAGG